MVNVPMKRPVQTSAGEIRAALLVLIDLQTEEGITGRAYVRSYSTFALEPLKQLVENLGAALAGEALAPLEIYRKLQAMFRLLGPQGLTGIAASGIDIAAWDALARAHGLPLVELLGGVKKWIPAYGSLRSMHPENVSEEVRELAQMGFDAYKVKIGRGDVGADLEIIRVVRGLIGEEAKLAVDYNQSLSVTGALERVRILDEEGLYWIEEPTRADDFVGHARIAEEARTPICIGENWWGPHDLQKSLEVGACDYGDARRHEDRGRDRLDEGGCAGRARGTPADEPRLPGGERASPGRQPDRSPPGVPRPRRPHSSEAHQDRGRADPRPRWARDRYRVGRASSGAIPHRMKWRQRGERGAAALRSVVTTRKGSIGPLAVHRA
jgi:mandelate racemase